MDEFWSGFYKKAEDAVSAWQEESEEEAKKSTRKSKSNVEIDPRTISQSFTPDTYWRSWP